MKNDYSSLAQSVLYEKIRQLEQNVSTLTALPAEEDREELLVALEELHVAEEELRQQNLTLQESQQLLLQEHQKYVTLFELSPVGHVLTTSLGEIVEANKAFVKLLQFTDDFLENKLLSEFLVDSSLLDPMLDLQQPTAVAEREIDFQPRIGEPIITSVAVTPIVDELGVPLYLLWGIYDLRHQKRVAQLEREMTAQKIQEQLDTEKAISSLKTEIMTIINHGFRTPLSIIQAVTDNLEINGDKMTIKTHRDKFRTIYDQVRGLADMLDKIGIVVHGVSKICELTPVPLNIVNHCENLIDQIRHSYGQSSVITLQPYGINETVLVDAFLLDMILTELIHNAILYSPVHNSINLLLSRSDNDLVFQVIDQGIGIPLTDQLLIFKSVHRGSNVSNRPGLGLGLKIAKECAELHGGTLSFTSEEKLGSTFTLRLPVFDKI